MLVTSEQVIALRAIVDDIGFRWTKPGEYKVAVAQLKRAEDAFEWQGLTARYEGKMCELPKAHDGSCIR